MQSTKVVVCVCPSRKGSLAGSASEGRSRRGDFDFEVLGPGFGAPHLSHSISELRETIHLRAREMTGAEAAATAAGDGEKAAAASTVATAAVAAAAAAAAEEEEQGGGDKAAPGCSQHVVFELLGRVCRSVLRVDAQVLTSPLAPAPRP